mgnify:CR=1 FL=1
MSLYRTMLFVPGNDAGKLLDAGIYRADSVIFDLEDAVSVGEKDAARDLVKNALLYNEYPCPVGVRINHISTPYGYDDLAAVLSAKPAFIRLPKAEETEDILEVDAIISRAEQDYGYETGSIKIFLTVETAKGIINSYKLASCCKRVVGMGMGAEDLTADLQATRTVSGEEILFCKSQILLAARAAGIIALDNVFADVSNEEGFIAETKYGKQLGFNGKSVIHPNQVALVHKVYTPSEGELAKSLKILAAYEEALANKSGVIALDGKMIDGPIVIRAQRVVNYARAVGMLKGDD